MREQRPQIGCEILIGCTRVLIQRIVHEENLGKERRENEMATRASWSYMDVICVVNDFIPDGRVPLCMVYSTIHNDVTMV